MLRALVRLLLSVGGAALASVLVALVEARWIVGAAAALGTAAPKYGSLVLAEVGVLFPVALGVGASLGTAVLLLDPGEPTSPILPVVTWRKAPLPARLRSAALSPLVVFGAFLWCLGAAHATKSALASGKPAEAGLTSGIAAFMLLLLLVTIGLALLPALRRALAHAGDAVPQIVDPALTTAIAVLVVVVLFAIGIALGDTSGAGGGALGIFGVLKRQELDLRPVADLAVLSAGAYGAPLVFARSGYVDPASGRPRSGPVLAGAGAVGLALAIGVLCVRASSALGEAEDVARGLEKDAPLGRISLAILRRATDRDRDGFSGRFGGGDCNDHDKAINPGAIDVPGNGVDEDCSGADTPELAPPVAANPADAGAPKRPKKTYNVVLITVDTLRPDLGFMGYPKPVSPNLDKVAAKATVFERAYSMASYTGKSVGPMHIGKYPSETDTNFSHFNTYYDANVFVAERARAAGVRTFAAMCHFYFKLPTGLSQGFDVWDTTALPPGMSDNDNSITSDRMSDSSLKLLANPENVTGAAAQPDAGAAEADAGAAEEALDAGGDDGAGEGSGGAAHRFFAWFHFFDPHMQYVPHAGSPDFSGDKGQFAQNRALYDQEVWFTDKHIGLVLDYIAAQPWADETAIILTSDHGEAFYEHGMLYHGSEIWEELVRVPLFVYVPGAEPRRVAVKRSHIDMAPTIMELLGLTLGEDATMHGKSLLDDVFLPEGAEHEERDVLVDMPQGPYNQLRRAIITGPSPGMKLIHLGASSYQLFDLAEDPGEKKDLWSDKERREPVLARYQQVRAQLKEVAPRR